MRHQELLALGIFSSRSRLGDRIELLLRSGRTFSPRVSAARVVVSAVALLGFFIGSSLAPRLLAFAQQPAFDAASIKPNNVSAVGGREGGLQFAPGGVAGTNLTVRRIILEAYHLRYQQLSGGPGWIGSDRFDLEAKVATPIDQDQLRLMLQTLLAERFKLTVRRESKETPVYALTVGKNGPKLREMKDEDSTPTGRHGVAGRPSIFMRANMHDFAARLSELPPIDRPVLDKTGLQGVYLFSISIDPDDDLKAQIEAEFGLKFESQKAPMDTLVIDHIEKPDPN
jgi:uncharacterized protein (TIGR03435 family)